MEDLQHKHKDGQSDWLLWLQWVFWGQWQAQDVCPSCGGAASAACPKGRPFA